MNQTKIGGLVAAVATLLLTACGSKGGSTAGGGGTETSASGAGGAGGAGTCEVSSKACMACANDTCASASSACSNDATCVQAQNDSGPCLCSAQAAGDAAAEQGCLDTLSGMGALEKAFADCLQQSCPSECL